ncbi:MAG TPA: hypothetical protein VEL76_14240 [Gemmataceae bacterium]|nr:hypothetical protein [Gemmataceae bacterium]
MMSLADLHRAVQTTLASKRLGQAVFVRYLLHGPDRATVALPRLAQLTAAVRDWIGQTLERVHALGSPKAGQVSLTLEFGGGATALVCWAASSAAGYGIDLTVLGNHGALYHDSGSARTWESGALPPPEAPDKALLAVLERALRSAAPVTVEGGAP